MGHLSSMFHGLARSFSFKKGRNSGKCSGREAAEAMAKEAKKNGLLLRTSGTVNVDGSNNFASVFSKKGQKGVNQDCCIVWEVYMLGTLADFLLSIFDCLAAVVELNENENLNCCTGYNNLQPYI
jgi:dTDP-4-dehydrorhamnose reductase